VLAASTVTSCDPVGCGLRSLATFDGQAAASANEASEAMSIGSQEYVDSQPLILLM
jgi:hypothetical protein